MPYCPTCSKNYPKALYNQHVEGCGSVFGYTKRLVFLVLRLTLYTAIIYFLYHFVVHFFSSANGTADFFSKIIAYIGHMLKGIAVTLSKGISPKVAKVAKLDRLQQPEYAAEEDLRTFTDTWSDVFGE